MKVFVIGKQNETLIYRTYLQYMYTLLLVTSTDIDLGREVAFYRLACLFLDSELI